MRTYGQFCPVARASELLAERWTPIIIRNLLNGCRTFGEIRQGAPGIPTALLAKRLDTLERHGIIARERLPAGRGWSYRLTEQGQDLKAVCEAMGQAGGQARSARGEPPKSHQSRTVPLPRFLAAELAAAVAGKHADQLVFTMPGGGVMRMTNWRRSIFLSARRRAGLSDRFRVHDLRHTAASLMIQAGYPPKMLQEIMGHASITTTLDLYGHLYPGEMDRYADRLNEAAGMSDSADDAAKMRPDDDLDEAEDEQDEDD